MSPDENKLNKSSYIENTSNIFDSLHQISLPFIEDSSLNAFLFKNPFMGIFTADASGRIISCNKKFMELFAAYRPEDINLSQLTLSNSGRASAFGGAATIKTVKNIEGNEISFISFDLISEILKEERENYSVLLDLMIPGDRTFTCEFYATIEKNRRGEVKRILGIAEDVTLRLKDSDLQLRDFENKEDYKNSGDDKARSGAYLHKREAVYSKLFSSINDAIIVSELPAMGKKGLILDANEHACKILGYTYSELRKMRTSDIMMPEYITKRAQYMWRFMRDGYIGYESVVITKSNQSIPVEVNAKIFMLDGSPIVVSIGRDIRDRKRVEDELKNYSKQLYELNAQKDRLFSIIAHDLRGPFNALLGLTSILANDIDDLNKEEIKTFASDTHKAGLRVFGLIENLLNWSRLQTGNLKFSPRRIYLSELCEKITDLFQPSFEQKSIRVLCNIEKQEAIYADYNMISSAVQNLISNAVKFTPEGGMIELNGRAVDGNIEIFVKDSGVGIKKENISKMFKMDERLSTEGTNNEQGSGLGLLLCKEFVEKNKGFLKVESEYGKGSVFTITLPKA
jgi:PAS domain S-box-containing protein